MSIFSKVEVRQLGDTINHFSVTVNGKRVDNVKSVDISVRTDEIPEAKITLNALPEFSGNAIAEFWIETESVHECIRAVRFELMTNENFANKTARLIASKINWDMDKAKEIVDLLSGELDW